MLSGNSMTIYCGWWGSVPPYLLYLLVVGDGLFCSCGDRPKILKNNRGLACATSTQTILVSVKTNFGECQVGIIKKG